MMGNDFGVVVLCVSVYFHGPCMRDFGYHFYRRAKKVTKRHRPISQPQLSILTPTYGNKQLILFPWISEPVYTSHHERELHEAAAPYMYTIFPISTPKISEGHENIVDAKFRASRHISELILFFLLYFF